MGNQNHLYYSSLDLFAPALERALNTPYYKEKFKNLSIQDLLNKMDTEKPYATGYDLASNSISFLSPKFKTNDDYSFQSSGYSSYSKTIYLNETDLLLHANYLRSFLGEAHLWDSKKGAVVVAPLGTRRVASFFATKIAPQISQGLKLVNMFDFDSILNTLQLKEYEQIFLPVPILIKLMDYYEVNDIDPSMFMIKKILTGGVVLPQSVKKRAGEMFNAKVANLYGMSEAGTIIASDEICSEGIHLIDDNYMGFELKPTTEEKFSEFIITCFQRNGTQIIRYGTGDIVEDISEHCTCKNRRPLLRWIGRKDDMTPIGQMNLWWNGVMERQIFTLDGLSDYRIILKRKENGIDHMVFKLRATRNIDREELVENVLRIDEELYKQIRHDFIEVSVDNVSIQEFYSDKFKPHKIIDERAR